MTKIDRMKSLIQTLPAWLKVPVYFLVLGLATFIAGIIPPLNDFIFFLTLSLLMSCIFLWSEGQSLWSLGFKPSGKKDWKDFFAGVLAGIIMLVLTAALTLYFTKDNWTINRHADLIYAIISFIMCLWSAFVQEFVFRGYPFQALLKKYGVWIAQLLIAIPFGLMHVNGSMSPQDIATVMLTTGLGSILYGLAYIKTQKLLLPIGLHLGWNYAQQLIPRASGGNDKGFLIVAGDPANYSFYNVLLPYLLIMVLAIILLSFKKREAAI